MRVRSKPSIAIVTITMALMACASPQPKDKNSALPSSVYVVGDASAPIDMEAVARGNGDGFNLQAEAMPRKLYWFLAGR